MRTKYDTKIKHDTIRYDTIRLKTMRDETRRDETTVFEFASDVFLCLEVGR
jgi:hypothetical protein